MGVAATINRALFATMSPSIVINEPIPRWKVYARIGLRVAALAVLAGASFYAGTVYERTRHVRARNVVAVPPPLAQEKTVLTQTPSMTATPKLATVEAPAAPVGPDGLAIQDLVIVRASGEGNSLRYEFAIAIETDGRSFEGTLEFLVRGRQQGREVTWAYPTPGKPGDKAFHLRVARYLKMNGSFDLPPGLMPQSVELRLRESGGLRVSRSIEVRGQAAPALIPTPARN